ncbi:uncharacterized protein V1516DRAFT_664297 [Lipomyces oligophaga]|uniref:uncharacterized protein n=1 Tax=Lipomyces oligophaga TaxID=45792 RepID=UPI0034CD12A3
MAEVMTREFVVDTDVAAERFYENYNGSRFLKSSRELETILSSSNSKNIIAKLAELALDAEFCGPIVIAFYPLMPALSGIWLEFGNQHRLIACAFARLLPLIPHLSPHAKLFFDNYQWPTPLELSDLIVAHRLLSFDFHAYSAIVDTLAILDIVLDVHADPTRRLLAIKIWALHLGLSDAETNSLLSSKLNITETQILGDSEDFSNLDFAFYELFEAKRITQFKFKLSSTDYSISGKNTLVLQASDFQLWTANLCGVLVCRNRKFLPSKNKIVYTNTTVRNVQRIAVALRTTKPLLISGPAGCGKTFLIDNVLEILSIPSENIVKIHLGDQADAKLLVGTYTTGEAPGSFVWKEGIIVKAVRLGYSIVIEDINKAPNEIISILLSLLQQRRIVVPSRGETIYAGPGFQMIATTTDTNSSASVDFIGRDLWQHVRLDMMTDSELDEVLICQFPRLMTVTHLMVNVYTQTRELYRLHRFMALTRGAQLRLFSTIDLIKWARRVNAIFANNNILHASSISEIPISAYEMIFLEALDCFAASIRVDQACTMVIDLIASIMSISPQVVNNYLNSYLPSISDQPKAVRIGRVTLTKSSLFTKSRTSQAATFAYTKHTLRQMEKIARCVELQEAVLLVGETGTGKTTIVQQLALSQGSKLVVINLSQQTDASDLLGGFKPVDIRSVAVPLREEFEALFEQTFSSKRNEKFNKVFSKCFNNKQWIQVIRLWNEAVKTAHKSIESISSERDAQNLNSVKRRRLLSKNGQDLTSAWTLFGKKVKQFEVQQKDLQKSFLFKFIEGALVRAVRNGDWILLDEINLASADTLENLTDLLSEDGNGRCIRLSESGDTGAIYAHPNFRLFACMNPATDIGKRDLPAGFRSRFTELFVRSPDENFDDLLAIIQRYIGQLAVGTEGEGACVDVAEIYNQAKKLAENHQIVDGANQKPHFSVRTLSRTLLYVRDISPAFGLRRALYEGFCMSFLTLLDRVSEEVLQPIIMKYTIGKLRNPKSVLSKLPSKPNSGNYVQFKHYWIEQGPLHIDEQVNYIITPFVEKNLLNLVRATATRRFPLLIQGPTSSGKTSMIGYLARKTGHKLVRINNHEHTDLQEYLGTYVADDQGRLSFQEGVLVEAARKGYWIVLDELNLAPTDVLEALNRLLDDNHEIFISETQEVVKPHPHFLLFATQNPPGLYGGRKNLSRAFRNRFLELHFDDIPEDELETILKGRCAIPPSYAKRIVQVYKDLSVHRLSTRLFEKNSFATLRDLFRWANRAADNYEELARNGYLLLAERVRSPEEQDIVRSVIEKVMKVKINIKEIYGSYDIPSDGSMGIIWNESMRRIFLLVNEAIKNREPVLLVGETGCGKTSVCQVLAEIYGKSLHIVNAHQNTEASDIIGAQRPLRARGELQAELTTELQIILQLPNSENLRLDRLVEHYDSLSTEQKNVLDVEAVSRIEILKKKLNVLFEWQDGSLITALRRGDFFLLDEISLTDDSVLERLNSVLEPERAILLAEKGSRENLIVAADGFQFLATMNPSGDYGKKELSPALRNRFTEIWVPPVTNTEDVYQIVNSKLAYKDISFFSEPLVQFSVWFSTTYNTSLGDKAIVSLRDILSWVSFINVMEGKIDDALRLLHGASMVFVDTLGTNNFAYLAQSSDILARERLKCIDYLSTISMIDLRALYMQEVTVSISNMSVSAGGFEIRRWSGACNMNPATFSFQAPTSAFNAMRIIRGMQLNRPIMLEGSPGVGKTTIMIALAALANAPLTRINLSDQTDLMDLFGADSPAEGAASGEFVWRDAPFLHAMKNGHWVLLDEMNLASQSVLEGLNACLDHRGEAYIPELDRTFVRHPNFKVFAAQNPHFQGGGRKGLPKSFINRFTVVYVDLLTPTDLKLITGQLFPTIQKETARMLVEFVSLLDHELTVKRSFGQLGAPWEFNLRDILRWFHLLVDAEKKGFDVSPVEWLDVIVSQRMRTTEDRGQVNDLYRSHFEEPVPQRYVRFIQSEEFIQVGHSVLPRQQGNNFLLESSKLVPLQCNMTALESLMTCVEQVWPAIIVGPSNSGKSSLIYLLARLVGADVEEFSINSDIDTIDIVGGFEQVDFSRRISKIFSHLRKFAMTLLLQVSKEETKFSRTNELVRLYNITGSSSEYLRPELSEASNLLSVLKPFIPKIMQTEANDFEHQIIALLDVMKLSEKHINGFEWFDGILVRAMESGSWLILDNANLCGPSILDRLNSLLEPNGVLALNERGMVDGEIQIVKAHPNFRLFLTMDPRNGELSRAMRNRGIEIYLDDLRNRATMFDRRILDSAKYFDNSKVNDRLDIADRLQQLALDTSIGTTHELLEELPPSLSCFRVYALLDSLLKLSSGISKDALARAAVGYLSLSQSKTINRWYIMISQSGYYSESEIGLAQVITNLFLFALTSPIGASVNEFLHDVPIPQFAAHQVISPELSLSVLTFFAFDKVHSLDMLSRAFSLMLLSRSLKSKIAHLTSQSEHMPVNERNYFQRTVISRQKRTALNRDEIIVLNSVEAGCEFLHEFFSRCTFESFDFEDLDMYNLFFAIQSMFDFFYGFILYLEQNSVDVARFPVFADILSKLTCQVFTSDNISVLNIIPEYIGSCADPLNLFVSRYLHHNTKSIDFLWRNLSGRVPTTLERWIYYEQICKSLERIVEADNNEKLTCNVKTLDLSLESIESVLNRGDSNVFNGTITVNSMRSQNFAEFEDNIINEQWKFLANYIISSHVLITHVVNFDEEYIKRLFIYSKNYSLLIDWIRYRDAQGLVAVVRNLSNFSHLMDGSFVASSVDQLRRISNIDIQGLERTGIALRLFAQALTTNSSLICASKVHPFMSLIWKNLTQILHLENSMDKSNAEFEQDLRDNLFQQIENPNAGRLSLLLLEIRSLATNASTTDKPEGLLKAGKVVVSFAIRMLEIYLPTQSYDPASRPYVENFLNNCRETLLKEDFRASEQVDRIFSGDDNSLPSLVLQLSLRFKIAADSEPDCFRPEDSNSELILRELSSFRKSYGTNEVWQFADHMQTDRDPRSEFKRAQSLKPTYEVSLSHLQRRLNHEFGRYMDLWSPALYFFQLIGHGLTLISHGMNLNSGDDLLQQFFPLMDGSVVVKTELNQILSTASDLSAQDFTQSVQVNINLRNWIQFRCSYLGYCDEVVTMTMKRLLDDYHFSWVRQREHDEADKISKTTIYRMHDSEDDDAEFKLMFPDYYSDESELPADRSIESAVVYAGLAKDFKNIFSDNINALTVSELFAGVIEMMKSFEIGNLGDVTLSQRMLSAIVSGFSQNMEHFEVKDFEKFNFYGIPLLDESLKAAKIFEKTKTRIHGYLQKWPENEILGDCLRESSTTFGIRTPIAKLLVTVENLLGSLHEWQKVASHEYSVMDLIDTINSLIISWRQLELKTWSSFFEAEKKKSEDEVSNLFFHLYGNLVAVPIRLSEVGDQLESHLLELASALTSFVSSSNIGQFETRLSLLSSFANFTSKLSNSMTIFIDVSSIISGIVRLYSQFRPAVDASLSSQRNVLNKEAAELIILAGWKDTNYLSLKESARRSHQKIFKLIKKYRSLLDQPVRPILETGLSDDHVFTSGLQITFEMPTQESMSVQRELEFCLRIPNWHLRPDRLKDIQSTISKAHSYCKNILHANIPSLLSYSLELNIQLRELRKETPNILTAENEHAVKFLKNRKAKLLSETLTSLKRLGLRFRVRADILESQNSVYKVICRIKDIQTILPDNSSDWLLRILEFMPRVRSLVNNHSDEITPAQIDRGINISENLLHMLILQREKLGEAGLGQLKKLTFVCDELSALASQSNHIEYFKLNSGNLIPEIIKSLKLCMALNTISLEVASNHEKFANEPASNAHDLILKFQDLISASVDKVEKLKVPYISGISSYDSMTALNSVKNLVHEYTRAIDQICASTPSVEYVFYNIRGYLQDIGILFTRYELQTSKSGSPSVSEVESSLRSLSDLILVVVQNVHQINVTSVTEEQDNWLPTSIHNSIRTVHALHISKVTNTVEGCLEQISQADVKQVSAEVAALCVLVKPFINLYQQFCEVVLKKIAAQHNEIAKGGLILMKLFQIVGMSGYCSPHDPKEDEDQSKTDAQTGTGLGEGEGEQNISNTVEDNENFDDISSEANKEGDKYEEQDDKQDAVDRTGDEDMEGEVESLDGAEDNDDENENDDGEDNEEEDLDEEIGDVDDLDLSALDEKLWNGEQEEKSSTENHIEQPLKDSTNTDDLSAKNDDTNTKEQQSEEEQNSNDASESEGEEDGEALNQDDTVAQDDESRELDPLAPEGDALELPDDLNLDGEDENEQEGDNEDIPDDDEIDGPADIDEIPSPDPIDSKQDDLQEQMETTEPETEFEETAPDEIMDDQPGDPVAEDQELEDEIMDDEDSVKPRDKLSEDSKDQESELQANLDSAGLQGPEENEDEESEATSKGAENGSKDSGNEADSTDITNEFGAEQNGLTAKDEAISDQDMTDDRMGDDAEKSTERQIGDSSKQFHETKREIEEASHEEQTRQNEESSSTYQHIDDAAAKQDTQALGAARKEEQQSIDHSQAIEDQIEQQVEEQVGEVADKEEMEATGENRIEADPKPNELASGGIIGERTRDIEVDVIDTNILETAESQSNHGLDQEDIPETMGMQVDIAKDQTFRGLYEARELWQAHERATADLSNALCEQLRLILEPTLTTKLRGDYRTGKRLNMKRIIPYIASEFKKDKIWMRRTKPSKRAYQIMISLDDSKSMGESRASDLAFDTITLVSKALERLEVGQMSIVRFGERCEVVHPFQLPFNSESGAQAFQWFGFDQTKTDVQNLVENSIKLFEEARSDSKGDLWQLELIISDGLCEDHEKLKTLVRRAREQKIMVVFIVVDGLNTSAAATTFGQASSSFKPSSIVDLSQVSYETDADGSMKLKVIKYLSSFPFEFYVIVRNITELPSVLSLVLRQYFAEVAELQS